MALYVQINIFSVVVSLDFWLGFILFFIFSTRSYRIRKISDHIYLTHRWDNYRCKSTLGQIWPGNNGNEGTHPIVDRSHHRIQFMSYQEHFILRSSWSSTVRPVEIYNIYIYIYIYREREREWERKRERDL